MALFVLDASAVLALVLHERGWDVVAEALPDACISAVNAAEVISRLIDLAADDAGIARTSTTLRSISRPFDVVEAMRAANLRRVTKRLGLSMGDRACLALAIGAALPILTADRAWASLDIGIEIRVVR